MTFPPNLIEMEHSKTRKMSCIRWWVSQTSWEWLSQDTAICQKCGLWDLRTMSCCPNWCFLFGWNETTYWVFFWGEKCPENIGGRGLHMQVHMSMCSQPQGGGEVLRTRGTRTRGTRGTLDLTRGSSLLFPVNQKQQGIKDNKIPELCFYLQEKPRGL